MKPDAFAGRLSRSGGNARGKRVARGCSRKKEGGDEGETPFAGRSKKFDTVKRHSVSRREGRCQSVERMNAFERLILRCFDLRAEGSARDEMKFHEMKFHEITAAFSGILQLACLFSSF